MLLGQNGTGKTTLLELVSMVVRSDFSSLAKEEFALEYELAVDGGECLVVVVRNDRKAMDPLSAGMMLTGQEVFRPSVEMLGGTDRRPFLRYDAEHGLTVEGAPPVSAADLPSLADPQFLLSFVARVPELVARFARDLVKTGTAQRFDESLDVFRRLTEGDLPGEFIVFAPRAWVPNPKAWFLVPQEILERITELYLPQGPEYAFTHETLDFLATLKDMMGFGSTELRVDVTVVVHPEASPLATVRLGNLRFRFGLPGGAFITHDRLSYGQKRLVTFFYYLACNPQIVIADELVNGLHHRWITASIEAIGDRQAFLTSQNPLLLDYIPITSVEAVRRSFVLCRGEPREGRPGWIWGNMSEDDAAELYRAYDVGVEHVSEILQSRGLW